MHLRPAGGIGIDGWILTAGCVVVLWAVAALMVLGLFRYLHTIPYVHDEALVPDLAPDLAPDHVPDLLPDLLPEAISASTATRRSPE